MEQIRAFIPFSRQWLKRTLGISEPDQLFLLQADQDLPPEIRANDLVLVDRSAGKKLPHGEGLYVFSVPTGLAVRRVQVGPGISEELEPMEIDRLLIGRIEPDPRPFQLKPSHRSRPLRCASARENYFGLTHLTCRRHGWGHTRPTHRGYGPSASSSATTSSRIGVRAFNVEICWDLKFFFGGNNRTMFWVFPSRARMLIFVIKLAHGFDIFYELWNVDAGRFG
jgi:hypothetical protein